MSTVSRPLIAMLAPVVEPLCVPEEMVQVSDVLALLTRSVNVLFAPAFASCTQYKAVM